LNNKNKKNQIFIFQKRAPPSVSLSLSDKTLELLKAERELERGSETQNPVRVFSEKFS
jgi:hypothetical protein